MTANILTQLRLKELLHYNPDTGDFTWIVKPSLSVESKSIAGNISAQGYRVVKINNKTYPIHRLAFLYMEGALPVNQVDHINHIRDDNRWCNLRAVTQHENLKNKCIYKCNKSGTPGVHWHKRDKRWSVYVRVNGKQIYGGYFTDKQKAITKRKALEQEHNFHDNNGSI